MTNGIQTVLEVLNHILSQVETAINVEAEKEMEVDRELTVNKQRTSWSIDVRDLTKPREDETTDSKSSQPLFPSTIQISTTQKPASSSQHKEKVLQQCAN